MLIYVYVYFIVDNVGAHIIVLDVLEWCLAVWCSGNSVGCFTKLHYVDPG